MTTPERSIAQITTTAVDDYLRAAALLPAGVLPEPVRAVITEQTRRWEVATTRDGGRLDPELFDCANYVRYEVDAALRTTATDY